jgi:hypothetical protein
MARTAFMRLLVGLGLAATATAMAAPDARAHVPIILVITSPQVGERVGTETELGVFAQAAIAGVEETSFTVDLDGRPLDPVSGLPAPVPVMVPIRVDQTKRIPVRDLADGEHTLTVTSQPHEGEPPQQGSVRFVAGTRGVGGVVAPALGIGAILAMLLTVGLLARRARVRRKVASDPPGG